MCTKRKIIVEEGEKRGRWTTLERTDGKVVKCVCECGVKKDVNKQNFIHGKTNSCGCLAVELAKKRLSTKASLNKKLYNVYLTMKNRCYNQKVKGYKDYGGRGIGVCQEWKESYSEFYDWAMDKGYKEGLTIERINVNGNYHPDNCSWITKTEQARNKRNNRFITIDGITKTLAEWSEISGVDHTTFVTRFEKGRSKEEIFSKDHPQKRYVSYKGKKQGVTEWAKELGISRDRILKRLNKGLPIDEVFDPVYDKNKSKPRMITLKGKTHSLSEWSRQLGVDRKTISLRIKNGWTEDEILNGRSK